MWARIQNGVVHEIVDIDPAGRFHPSLQFVPCSAAVKIGHLWDGAAFTSPPPPAPVVLTCTPWQIRKALNQLGLRDAVEAYVAASDQSTKDGWEFALEFREDDALVLAAQAALGLTDADRTNLFTLARTL